ncbi:hypothetical protein [Streptomyces sp. NPDC002187]|uniref:hypothetical protein n=1 Tax=Streptomyces sp. NPDC002187 TaxID=3364637 RepID=UPI00367ACBB0
MSFGKDPADFRLALTEVIKRDTGVTDAGRNEVKIGLRLLDFLYMTIGAVNLLGLLRCGESASKAYNQPDRGPGPYSDHLARALEHSGFPADNGRMEAARHVFLELHRVTGQEDCDLLIRWGIEALKPEPASV